MLNIGPIWRAMLRNKAGFVLIALQIAVTLTIMVNAIGIIHERTIKVGRDRNSSRSLPNPTRAGSDCRGLRPGMDRTSS